MQRIKILRRFGRRTGQIDRIISRVIFCNVITRNPMFRGATRVPARINLILVVMALIKIVINQLFDDH